MARQETNACDYCKRILHYAERAGDFHLHLTSMGLWHKDFHLPDGGSDRGPFQHDLDFCDEKCLEKWLRELRQIKKRQKAHARAAVEACRSCDG